MTKLNTKSKVIKALKLIKLLSSQTTQTAYQAHQVKLQHQKTPSSQAHGKSRPSL